MANKCDKSTKVGGRRNQMGSDMTAGNSLSKPGSRRKFQDTKAFTVAREDKRSTQYRKGRRSSV